MAPADGDQDDDNLHAPLMLAGFAQFYRDNFDRLAKYVQVRGGHAVTWEEAKEITQATMTNLYKHLNARLQKPTSKPIRDPLPYAFTCARNELLRVLKRRAKEAALQKHARSELDLARERCEGDRKAAWAYLQCMLRSLTPAQRDVMLLVAQGAELSEIAQILGKSLDAIKKLKSNAFKRLRETHPAWGDPPNAPATGKDGDR